MRGNDDTKQRVEKVLLEAIERAAAKVGEGPDADLWARAAADLAIAFRAVSHYDDAPIGLGTAPPTRKS